MFNVNKTVQDVTQEFFDVMNLNEFPQIPFVVQGYLEGLIEKIEFLVIIPLIEEFRIFRELITIKGTRNYN